jgi:HK97 family phage portal protein
MYAIAKARASIGALNARGRTVYPKLFSPPYGGATYFGQVYNWEQVLHFKQWIFSCIRAWIREVAGGEPLNVGRMRKRDQAQVVRAYSVKKALHGAVNKVIHGPKASHEFVPFDDDDLMLRLFEKPNELDTAYDFWAYTILFYCLTGTAHWWVMRNDWGVPVEMWVIPTHWAKLQTAWEGQPFSYLVQSPWGTNLQVPYDEVLSFHDHSPLNRYEGYGVLLAMGEWIDAYEAGVRARLAQYKNGAIPNFHIALGDTFGDPDESMLRRYYAKWFMRFQGEDRTNQPIITGPDVEIKPLGISPVEMGYQLSEETGMNQICSAFGVPKAILGLEPPADTSGYAPQRAFCRFAVNPTLKMFGERVTQFLIRKTPGYEDGVAYWDDHILDDPERKLTELTQQFDRGIITVQEFRNAMGHAPYPHGGDDPMINGSPLPWVTGKKQEQEGPELEGQVREALGHDGYSMPTVDKEEEPDLRTTEYRTDTYANRDGDWVVDIWEYPSGRQAWRTPAYDRRRDAQAHAERWVARRRHRLHKPEEQAMGTSSGTGGGFTVPPSPVVGTRGVQAPKKRKIYHGLASEGRKLLEGRNGRR